jgi:hypothetical protein
MLENEIISIIATMAVKANMNQYFFIIRILFESYVSSRENITLYAPKPFQHEIITNASAIFNPINKVANETRLEPSEAKQSSVIFGYSIFREFREPSLLLSLLELLFLLVISILLPFLLQLSL